jgi:hypothetical protein
MALGQIGPTQWGLVGVVLVLHPSRTIVPDERTASVDDNQRMDISTTPLDL